MCYNSSPVHTENVSGYRVEIWHDDDSQDPVTDFDIPGIFANFDGDMLSHTNAKHVPSSKEDFAAMIREERYSLVITFRHGRYQHMSANRVNWYDVDPYDLRGISGFLVMDKATIADNWGNGKKCVGGKVDGKKRLTPCQCAEKYALSVLSEIGDYYDGNVYGFKVFNPDGEEMDSCWGFIGDYDGYVLEEAKSIAVAAAESAKQGEEFAEKFFHL